MAMWVGEGTYGELRRIAACHLRRERDRDFAPGDLIGEAYVRLARGGALAAHDRAHFYAIVSRSMRQILVDQARRRRADKRGAGVRPVALEADWIGVERAQVLDELADALGALGKLDARKLRVTELHYFGGLTQDEIAAACDVHVNTVARDLRFSEAWLRRALRATA
ncbi:MAG TPA: ECF-type sigma factor [Kofleriaceae bacterium]|nr:ECF-type sigma factor [Kofleriaceae bacterium]